METQTSLVAPLHKLKKKNASYAEVILLVDENDSSLSLSKAW